jgi:hypothetical protein
MFSYITTPYTYIISAIVIKSSISVNITIYTTSIIINFVMQVQTYSLSSLHKLV